MGSCHSSSNTANDSVIEYENLETFSLVWLDRTGDKSTKKNAMQQDLRAVINYLQIFHHEMDCEEYIKRSSKDEYVILIVEDQVGEKLLPKIHHIEQIFAIYISTTKQNLDQSWMNEYNKVRVNPL